MRTSFVIAVFGCSACSASGCTPSALNERWTCDFDSSVPRPLSDPDAVADDAGALSARACQSTCGPPVLKCAGVPSDGGQRTVSCPVCTF